MPVWSALSLVAIVLSLIYPYVLGQGPEGLSPADLRDLRFQHYLRTLVLLALWLVAPRGRGLSRAMLLIAGLGLFFSDFVFAADGLNRVLWGLTAITAVWAAHYRGGDSGWGVGDGRPGLPITHYRGGDSGWGVGDGRPGRPITHGDGSNSVAPPFNGRGFPPAGSPGGVWPTPSSEIVWNQPLGGNGFPPPGSPGGAWPPPPQGAGWNQPLGGNGFPPPYSAPAVRPPDMAGGKFTSPWTEAAALGLFKNDDQPQDIFSRVCDTLIKINLIVLVIYCVSLAAWTFFVQYHGADEDEMFGLVFSFLTLPFVVAPSILLPGLMNALLVKAGGGRQIFVAIAGTAAAASLALTLAAAVDPFLNGPLVYDRFEALAGLMPPVARWAGAAAIVTALALLVTRKLTGDDEAEYPQAPPAALAALPPLLGLAAAALVIWAGDAAYGRFFAVPASTGPLAAERLGPLEVKLPNGWRLGAPETIFQLDGGRVALLETTFETEEEAAQQFAEMRASLTPKNQEQLAADQAKRMEELAQDVRKSMPDADQEQLEETLQTLGGAMDQALADNPGQSRVFDLEGREHQTFVQTRWYKRPAYLDEYDLDTPEWMEAVLWQKRPGGYLSLELRRNFTSKGQTDEALQALADETREQLTAWTDAVFSPNYRWVGPGGEKPADRWLTAAGYLQGEARSGLSARFASRDHGVWGLIAWNVPPEEPVFNPFQSHPAPVSAIGRAGDHYRGRAGLSRSAAVAGLPGRETMSAGREGCMLRYGCRNIELNWAADNPRTPLRLEVTQGGLMSFTRDNSQDLRRQTIAQWRAVLQNMSVAVNSEERE